MSLAQSSSVQQSRKGSTRERQPSRALMSFSSSWTMTAQGKIIFWGGARVRSMVAAWVPTFNRSHTLPDHRFINPSRSASGLRDLSTQRGTELPSWSKATGVSSCMGRVNRESLGLADCPGPQAGVCFFPPPPLL